MPVKLKPPSGKPSGSASNGGATKPSAGRKAERALAVTPTSLGWVAFRRNGGAVIEEISRSGKSKTIGVTPVTPQVRLRPISKSPNAASKVRPYHDLTFEEFKSVHRQARTLVAMGVPFVVRSRNHAVVVDRHPDFRSELIDAEVRRIGRSGGKKVASELLDEVKRISLVKLPPKPQAPAELPKQKTRYIAAKPTMKALYGQLKMVCDALRGMMPPSLYDDNMAFLRQRAEEAQRAELSRRRM